MILILEELFFLEINKNNFTFAGIQIIDPQIIRYFPFILKYIKNLINQDIKISAYIKNNSYFKDIGNIKNYLKLIKIINIPETDFYSEPIVVKTKK